MFFSLSITESYQSTPEVTEIRYLTPLKCIYAHAHVTVYVTDTHWILK